MVAQEMEWSLSKVLRIEAGTASISASDVRALLGLYRIQDPEQVDQFVAWARYARGRNWWDAYADVLPAQARSLLGMESEAAAIRSYDLLVVPPLLRTRPYGREVIRSERGRTLDAAERLEEIQVRRSELVGLDNPPRLTALLDEGVLHRVVGGEDILREQLEYLVELANRPAVTLRVVPFKAAARPLVGRPFVILDFPDPDDDGVLCLDNGLDGRSVVEGRDRLGPYLEAYERLEAAALAEAASVALIKDVAGDL
jgi:hypothetical protein